MPRYFSAHLSRRLFLRYVVSSCCINDAFLTLIDSPLRLIRWALSTSLLTSDMYTL